MPVEQLNQHTGLSPANIVMVDYRNADEIVIHFLDPHAGLSATIWKENTNAKFPDHFKFDNKHGVDFNFPLIKGFVQEGRTREFCEVHINGSTAENPIKFDIKNMAIYDIGVMYQNYQGHIPKLYYMAIDGQQTVIVTPHAVDVLDFKRNVVAMKTAAKRPGTEAAKDAPKASGPDKPTNG